MKRYVIVMVLAGLVFSCMAQHGNDTSRRVVVRPSVEILLDRTVRFSRTMSARKCPFRRECLQVRLFWKRRDF